MDCAVARELVGEGGCREDEMIPACAARGTVVSSAALLIAGAWLVAD